MSRVRWASPAAAAIHNRHGWPACAARCGWPVDPAGDDGTVVHPGCDTRSPITILNGGKR